MTCRHCKRPMRASHVRHWEEPDKVVVGGGGYCASCKSRILRHGTLKDWMPGPARWLPDADEIPLTALDRVIIRDERPWIVDARCARTDPETFFPDKGTDVAQQIKTAKAVCALCTVREPCLEWALLNGERYGVWGGASVTERSRLLKGNAA